MRQSDTQNSDRPPRGTSRSSRATNTRGANGGLLILTIDDSARTAFNSSASEERGQGARRSGPRRTLPR